MQSRTALMYAEIGCFVSCVCGWTLLCSTLPTPFWTYSENSRSVITTGDHFSNLWQNCVSDSTGATACKSFPSMMALSGFLHGCRALAVCAVITGFFGGVLTLIGMKCTKIGGSDIANARVTFSGGITYLVSGRHVLLGFCGMITYSWWADTIRTDFLNPQYMDTKNELGAAIFIGWGGSVLLILGGAVLTYFSGKEVLPSGSQKGHQRPGSGGSSRSRCSQMPLASPCRVNLASPLLCEGRESRIMKATTETGQAKSRDYFV